ncbi:hypothetical protein MNBD_GAMMA09-2140 [hydrothermal vent metagenome]|uniref:Uncharacterized protein n=1 Tax=hydrothermal vent metagenome TaxID=652676 RepID=A0A3B0XQE3_9ZZZZ
MTRILPALALLLCFITNLSLADDLEYNLTDAINRGDLQRAEKLIKKGADVNKKVPPFKQAPIVMAPLQGLVFVKLLVKNNADINSKDQDNTTALINACLYGKLDTVKFLIAEGADVHAINNDDMSTLEAAKLSENKILIQFIKSAGAQ